MSKIYKIGDANLSIAKVQQILEERMLLEISSKTKQNIINCRIYLDKKINNSTNPIYGINTGFGSLCNHIVSKEELNELQENLVLSHACGLGKEVPQDIVKIMLLLKIQSLCLGRSGVQLNTVERLVEMYNHEILPVVYQQGSLGASGDLAPLAHLSLFLIGRGEVDIPIINEYGSYKRKSASEIHKKMNWTPIKLESKEGLALLNGTQFMSAYGVWSLIQAKRISYFSDLIGSMSLEAFDCKQDSFDELLQNIRPHSGQMKTSKNIREFIEDSEIQKQKKEHVQDPYSFRCIPQIHGATKDVIKHVLDIFTIEINSVTDNPTIFIEEDKILSGGNFHGQPLAMSMDYLAIALSELSSVSERRIYQLISGARGLPLFLTSNAGLNSGMMIPQYTAASIVSQNKQLCSPSSIDSITSSNGQEDHVSMGANSATKLYQIVLNTERVLSIELMNASQALDFRKFKSSHFIETILDLYREKVKHLEQDRLLRDDIEKSILFIRNLSVDHELL